HNLAETGVTIVEVRRRRERDEELPAVGVRAAIGHRHDAGLVVPQLRMELVREVIAGPADALAERIAALDHESVDHPMKDRPVVVRLLYFLIRPWIAPLLRPFSQPDEILDRSRRLLIEQAHREISLSGSKLRVGSRHMRNRGYHSLAVQFRP